MYGLSVTYEDASSHNKDFEDDHIQTLNVGQNGKISFERPSEYFRITVDLSSLPSGIGISNYTCDYDSTKTHDLFTLFSVENAEVIMENPLTPPEYVFYNRSNERIYCNYSIQPTISPAIATLKNNRTGTFNGTIQCGKTFNFSKSFDLSELSSLQKVTFYSNTNQITEAQKIEEYCDIIITQDFSNEICINEVFEEIQEYTNNNTARMSASLASKTAQVLSAPSINDFPNYIENSFFRIHYESTLPHTVAIAIGNAFLSYRNHLNGLGFADALPDSNFNSNPNNVRYNVYVTASSRDDDECGPVGVTIGDSPAGGKKTTSHIYLFNVTSTITDVIAETIAHEYFHAVQYAYNAYSTNTSKWFTEACASWYSVYMGNGALITDHINTTFDFGFFAQSLYVFSKLYGYGRVLFPLTIDISYGGYETIRLMYVYLATLTKDIEFPDIKNALNYAISANNQTGTFDDVFRTFAIHTSDPNYYYRLRIPIMDEDEDTYYQWNNTSYVSSSYSYVSCHPYGVVYTKLTPANTNQVYSVSGSITFDSNSSNSLLAVTKVKKSSTGARTSSIVTSASNTFPIYESALGGSQSKEVYYAIMYLTFVNDVTGNHSISATISSTATPIS